VLPEYELEAPILFATLSLAAIGGFSAFASRLLFGTHHGRAATSLFFASMILVASTTLLALGIGSNCWITGSGSLLFMSLIGTIAPRPQASPSL